MTRRTIPGEACAVCGDGFTPEEWEARHDDADGRDCHADCCQEAGCLSGPEQLVLRAAQDHAGRTTNMPVLDSLERRGLILGSVERKGRPVAILTDAGREVAEKLRVRA